MTKQLTIALLATLVSLANTLPAQSQLASLEADNHAYTIIDTNPGGPSAHTVAPLAGNAQVYPQLTGSVEADQAKLSIGSRFRVALMTPISSTTAIIGDTVQAELLDDLTVNGITVANKGDVLTGQVTSAAQAERTIKSYIPRHHFLDPEGRIGITFITITDKTGRSTAISASMAPGTTIVSAESTKLHLIINKYGQAEVKSITTRYLVADAILAGGLIAAGPIGLAVAPAVTGIAGAVSPSYALGHQIDANEKTSRTKDFMLGVTRGVPGGCLVSGVATKGAEIRLNKGDQIVVQLDQDANFDL